MNILLLNPPAELNKKFIREGRCTQEQGAWGTLWPPVSLAMTGAVLEKEGHAVRIIDCPASSMSFEHLEREMRQFNPRLVIWSTGTPSIESDLAFAGAVKKILPACTTAVFGTHVTALDRQCLQAAPALDCILRNEPELTARELAHAIASHKDFSAIAGLTWRDPAGAIISNQARPFIDNLDSLPFPAWHLLSHQKYVLPLKGRPFLIIMPQRGCPFNCTFCTGQTYYGKKLRTRSPANIIAEIQYDMERFGVRDFFIWAETFVIDRQHVAELCQAMLDANLAINWTCNSRIDIVDEKLLKLMARAGCWMISYGIESADQQVLDAVRKGTRVEQAAVAVSLARAAGLKTAGHFIFGLPGDTEEAMEKTLKLARSLRLDVAQFYSAVPFPGSPLYEQALEHGWIETTDFAGFSQNSSIMRIPGLPPETVNRCRAAAYRQFYFNPLTWLRTLRMFEWQGIKNLFLTAGSFFSWSK
jgi:anaerobic magnesium-protoporphyrin IX monomethyl ester cyclase